MYEDETPKTEIEEALSELTRAIGEAYDASKAFDDAVEQDQADSNRWFSAERRLFRRSLSRMATEADEKVRVLRGKYIRLKAREDEGQDGTRDTLIAALEDAGFGYSVQ